MKEWEILELADWTEQELYEFFKKEPIDVVGRWDLIDGEWIQLEDDSDVSRDDMEPKCACGCDVTYGEKNNLHAFWCPKYKES